MSRAAASLTFLNCHDNGYGNVPFAGYRPTAIALDRRYAPVVERGCSCDGYDQ